MPATPANVVVAPLATTMARMRALPVSATNNVPEIALYAIPRGDEKDAERPTPSVAPAPPLPARVDTTPPYVTVRTTWFKESAT